MALKKTVGQDAVSQKELEKSPNFELPRKAEAEKPLDQAVESAVESEKKQEIAPKEQVKEQILTKSSGTAALSVHTRELKAIENILSDGLQDLYKNLPANRQSEFKKKGEETAGKIAKLLESAKIKIKKIINLIKDWLSMLPGVNKYYIEKEAKIKAEKLANLKNKK